MDLYYDVSSCYEGPYIVSLSFSVNFAEVCVQVSVGASEALHCPDSGNREVA